MKDRNRNIIVGVTAIAGLVALAYLIFMFGDMPALSGDFYKVTFRIDDASGLSEGSRVRLLGVDIGQISEVALMDDPSHGVALLGLIEQKYDIPAGSTVVSEASLLGGSAALNIIPPAEAGPKPALPRDGSATLEARSASLAKQLTGLTQGITEDLGRQLENFGKVSESIVKLSEQYIAVGKRLEEMVEPRPLAEVDAGNVPANLSTVLMRADVRLAELRQTTERINALLTDEQIVGDIRASTQNLRQFTATANEVATNANELTVEAKAELAKLTDRYIQVADDLVESLDSLNALLADARAGKGSLGRLMQDPALYNSLTDMGVQFQDFIKEARLLIQKWKAEGLPVQF